MRFRRLRELPWPVWVVPGLVVLLLGLHLYVVATTRHTLRNADVQPAGCDGDLVVLLHAYARDSGSLKDLRRVVTDELHGARVLAPDYDASLFSNAAPEAIASALRLRIGGVVQRCEAEARPFRRIILIGHSVGALIVRRAYLDQLEQDVRGGVETWARRVDRIILLAGMNRGWSVSPRPRNMFWFKQRWIQAGLWVARLSGTGRLIRGVEVGAPFVADLRLQWIRAARAGLPLAPVFQMLGVSDDLVTREDNMDLHATPRFTFIDVPDGHGAAVEFDSSSGGRDREAVFRRLVREPDVHKLSGLGRQDIVREMQARLRPVDHVVFIIHGIRDDAEWIGGLERVIARRVRQATDGLVIVRAPEYGYFPMGSFLVSPWRQERVRWFVDRYTEEVARATGTAKVSFIGHSNGTYLLAKGMLDYQQLRFHNVAFAGSVVPQAYPWDKFVTGDSAARITAVRNDRGDRDWVVAVLPRLFEILAGLVGAQEGWLTEVGSGGFRGFTNASGKQQEHVLRGWHDAGIQSDNFESLAEFVLSGRAEPPQSLRVESKTPDAVVLILSRLSWLLWLLLVGLAVLVGFLFTWLLGRPHRWKVPAWASWFAYVVLVLALLQTW